MQQIETLSRQAVELYLSENIEPAKKNLVLIEQAIMSNPFQLNEVEDFRIVGKALMCVLHSNIFKQAEKVLSMANICYLCLSKSIQNLTEEIGTYRDRTNIFFDSYVLKRDDFLFESYVDRANLLRGGSKLLQYEIITAFGLMHGTLMLPFQMSNDYMNDMEISDIESILKYGYEVAEGFEERKQELERRFPNNKEAYNRAVDRGIRNNNNFFTYLENKVLKQGNVIFRPQI